MPPPARSPPCTPLALHPARACAHRASWSTSPASTHSASWTCARTPTSSGPSPCKSPVRAPVRRPRSPAATAHPHALPPRSPPRSQRPCSGLHAPDAAAGPVGTRRYRGRLRLPARAGQAPPSHAHAPPPPAPPGPVSSHRTGGWPHNTRAHARSRLPLGPLASSHRALRQGITSTATNRLISELPARTDRRIRFIDSAVLGVECVQARLPVSAWPLWCRLFTYRRMRSAVSPSRKAACAPAWPARRVVKMFVWEAPVEEATQKLRQFEEAVIRQLAYWR